MKIIKFILLLLPWFLSSLIITDTSFYNEINLPFFAPNGIVFGIVWPILYILITISVYLIYKDHKPKEVKAYTISLLVNYFFNQSFTFVFFGLHNLFLGFAASFFTFISAIILFMQTKELNKKAGVFLIPYIIWCFFASILSFSIYIINL